MEGAACKSLSPGGSLGGLTNKDFKIIYHAFLGRVNEYQGSWKLEPMKHNFKQILGWGDLIDFLSLYRNRVIHNPWIEIYHILTRQTVENRDAITSQKVGKL